MKCTHSWRLLQKIPLVWCCTTWRAGMTARHPKSPASGLPIVAGSGLEYLLHMVAPLEPVRAAVVHPCDLSSLQAALEARAVGLVEPVLVAPRQRLEALAEIGRAHV